MSCLFSFLFEPYHFHIWYNQCSPDKHGSWSRRDCAACGKGVGCLSLEICQVTPKWAGDSVHQSLFITCIRIVILECRSEYRQYCVSNIIFELSYVTDTIPASLPTMKWLECLAHYANNTLCNKQP